MLLVIGSWWLILINKFNQSEVDNQAISWVEFDWRMVIAIDWNPTYVMYKLNQPGTANQSLLWLALVRFPALLNLSFVRFPALLNLFSLTVKLLSKKYLNLTEVYQHRKNKQTKGKKKHKTKKNIRTKRKSNWSSKVRNCENTSINRGMP